jgi:hypothetical protein
LGGQNPLELFYNGSLQRKKALSEVLPENQRIARQVWGVAPCSV